MTPWPNERKYSKKLKEEQYRLTLKELAVKQLEADTARLEQVRRRRSIVRRLTA